MDFIFHRLVLFDTGRAVLGDRCQKDPELDLALHCRRNELHSYLLHGNVVAPLGREPIGDPSRRSSFSLGGRKFRPLFPGNLYGTLPLGDLLVDVSPKILREDLAHRGRGKHCQRG